MKEHLYMYAEIRTPNMLPDRSADIVFQVDKDGNPLESLTQQQFQRECDINFIVKQNQDTGLISHVNHRMPQFGDFGDATDFQSALNYLQEANDAFMSLDAHVRARFQNDPAQLLDFLTNPENIEEAIKLGLAVVNKPNDPTFSSAQLDQLDRIAGKKPSKKLSEEPQE